MNGGRVRDESKSSLSLGISSESDEVENGDSGLPAAWECSALTHPPRTRVQRVGLRALFGDCGTGTAAGGALAKRARAELTRIDKPVDPADLDQEVTEGAIVLHASDTFITAVAGRGKRLAVNIATASQTRKSNHHQP